MIASAELPAPLSQVVDFARSFGEAHTTLAMHAALPVGLTPNLVHLLRVNFVNWAPWAAESDLLLSPLCAEVGAGSYEMSPSVRKILLGELIEDPEFGASRLRLVARFLLEYASAALHRGKEEEERDLLAAIQWSALAYLQPRSTAEALAALLAGILERKETQGVAPLVSIILDLSQVLALDEDLLLYSGALRQLVTGDRTTALRMLEAIGPADLPVQVGNVPLPAPGKLLRSLVPVSARAETVGTERPIIPGLLLRTNLAREGAQISSLTWAPSRESVVLVDQRRRILWWDVRGGDWVPVTLADDLNSTVDCVAISPDGGRIALGGTAVKVFALPMGRPSKELRPLLQIEAELPGPVATLSWSPDASLLAVASLTGQILLFEGATGGLLFKLWSRPAAGSPFAWQPSGESSLAYIRVDGDIELFSVKDGQSRPLCQDPIRLGLPSSPSGDEPTPQPGDSYTGLVWVQDVLFASLAGGGLVRFHVESGKVRYVEGTSPRGSARLSLSSDGNLLAVAEAAGPVRIWRTDQLSLIGSAGEVDPMFSAPKAVFHPSLPLLAVVGTKGGQLQIWEIDSSAVLKGPRTSYGAAKMVFVGYPSIGKTELIADLLHLKGDQSPVRESRLAGVLNRRDWLDSGFLQVRQIFLWELPGSAFLSDTDLLTIAGADLVVVVVDARRSREMNDLHFREWSELVRNACLGCPLPRIWTVSVQDRQSAPERVLEKINWDNLPTVADEELDRFGSLLGQCLRRRQLILSESDLAKSFLASHISHDESRDALDRILHPVEAAGRIRRLRNEKVVLLEPELPVLYTKALLESAASVQDRRFVDPMKLLGKVETFSGHRLGLDEEGIFLAALLDELKRLGVLPLSGESRSPLLPQLKQASKHGGGLDESTGVFPRFPTTERPVTSVSLRENDSAALSEQQVIDSVARIVVQEIYVYNRVLISKRQGALPASVRQELAHALKYLRERFGDSEAVEQAFRRELERILDS